MRNESMSRGVSPKLKVKGTEQSLVTGLYTGDGGPERIVDEPDKRREES